MKGLRLLQTVGAVNLPESILDELEGDPTRRGLDLHEHGISAYPEYVISPLVDREQPRVGKEIETNENETSTDRVLPRSARTVIDQVAGANYRLERLLYSVALLSLVGAVASVIFFASDKRPYIAIMTVLPVVVFWSTLNSARRVHSENMLIRLLEIPLSKTSTSTEAAHVLLALLADSKLNIQNDTFGRVSDIRASSRSTGRTRRKVVPPAPRE
jgi:hypothetical protein